MVLAGGGRRIPFDTGPPALLIAAALVAVLMGRTDVPAWAALRCPALAEQW